MKFAKKMAARFAVTEIVLAVLLAGVIVAWTPREPEAMFLWFWLMLATYPVSLLLRPLTGVFDHWPHVPFLPGIAGDWPNLLSPLLFFCTLGAAWWWLLGFGFGWLHSLFRPPRA